MNPTERVPDGPDAVLEWLSSPTVPPVRYLVAREFGYPSNGGAHLGELHEAVLTWEPLNRILALQKPDGSFPNRTKTRTGGPTLAALILMARCGLSIADGCVQRSVNHIVRARLFQGVFTVRGRGSGVLPCYVGMLARAVFDLAGPGHPLFQDAVKWILEYQRFDHKKTRGGGAGQWPYKSGVNYGGCFSSVSCFHGVGPTLRTLSAVPPGERSDEITTALEAAIEYLRIHRVYKKSALDKPMFRYSTNLYLFGAYRSNLLDVLEGLAEARPELGSEDWVSEAVNTVRGLSEDGKLVAAESYRTELVDPLPLEEPGKPSRFLTYQWLKVRGKFACHVA